MLNILAKILSILTRCITIVLCLNRTFLCRKTVKKKTIPELRRKFMIRLVDAKMTFEDSMEGKNITVATMTTTTKELKTEPWEILSLQWGTRRRRRRMRENTGE